MEVGSLGFGGPIATIAYMERLCVERKWLSTKEFSHAFAIIKLFPGAIGTQMAVYLGRLRGGYIGGILAGSLYILPSLAMVLILSVWSKKASEFSWIASSLKGLQVMALAVAIQSAYGLAKPWLKSREAILIIILSALATWAWPTMEPLIILFWGILALRPKRVMAIGLPLFLLPLVDSQFGQFIFLCVKAGWVTFGSGLAIVPLLESQVVGQGWISHGDFLQAMALGQMTPGPILITVSAIGYKLQGVWGACIAAVAVFGPGFLNVLFVFPMIEKLLATRDVLARFSTGAIPAVVGTLIYALLKLGHLTLMDFDSLLIFAFGVALLLSKKPLPVLFLIMALIGNLVTGIF